MQSPINTVALQKQVWPSSRTHNPMSVEIPMYYKHARKLKGLHDHRDYTHTGDRSSWHPPIVQCDGRHVVLALSHHPTVNISHSKHLLPLGCRSKVWRVLKKSLRRSLCEPWWCTQRDLCLAHVRVDCALGLGLHYTHNTHSWTPAGTALKTASWICMPLATTSQAANECRSKGIFHD